MTMTTMKPKSLKRREQRTSSEFLSHYCVFTPNRVQMFRGVRPSVAGSIVTCVPHIGAHLPVSHPRSRIQNQRFPAAGLGPAFFSYSEQPAVIQDRPHGKFTFCAFCIVSLPPKPE
jgi:hypothetical protein